VLETSVLEFDVSGDAASADAVQAVCAGRSGIGNGVLEVSVSNFLRPSGAIFGFGAFDLEIWSRICSCAGGYLPCASLLDMDRIGRRTGRLAGAGEATNREEEEGRQLERSFLGNAVSTLSFYAAAVWSSS
ncbi:MAG: hypothetical protein ACRD2S_03690, partial [Terriglobales bacterium]